MESRITAIYPEAKFIRTHVDYIYVADFSERTNAARKVEVHEHIPDCPLKQNKKMDCFRLCNTNLIPIDFHIFAEHQLVDGKGNDIEHCECCFFPIENSERIWIGFLEIKDCKVKNIAKYKNKSKQQIISTVHLFQEKGLLNSCRVYGIISFPRHNKVGFDQTIFEDITEYKRLYKTEHIRFFASNDVIANSISALSLQK